MLQIVVAVAASMLFALAATPAFIKFMRSRGIGALANPDRPATHLAKAGTPDMGGVLIIAAATVGYVAAHVRPALSGIEFRPFTSAGLLVLAAAWGLGAVGVADDLRKNLLGDPRGLSKRQKMIGSLVVGAPLCWAAITWGGLNPQLTFVGAGIGPALPALVFGAWVLLIIAGTTHAVNITDGCDGLVGGIAAMVFFLFVFVGFWEFRHPSVYQSLAAGPAGHLDLAVAASALFGACIGFMWWNAPPSRVIMGDSGALGLGGAIAMLALMTRTQLLLPIIGGVFVIEAATSWVQTQTINRWNKRIFRKAPIHHHFEELGWHEVTVVTRFWILGAVLVGFGLALFYNHYLTITG